ncbi:MAG: hypothetical protein CO030_03775 [Candidatus Magasanikbacteria bacterium CG_4_9_14_0_2_um_filter_42_11]|uniref:Thioredoxin domain-containing protein n=1 Tax=Candidatus Magasanikbacteria bacterium CG_4_9_14_0_2_um_filter_42_11 TaxID=1974643 RepID=A0A2M8F993_9BACT|nr:MAG: hypothetical protein COU34_02040 [Candidatus Magasanikbacteria bacterium CG10_big_fil_rev_8_21_14_0_10_43_9]PJC52266.1 MAG: hypothetical protein CO030_03775 [Candidatus Magasanikbacteria bacterium CG_4_9_14_0_2_um_filter_42_11]
MKKTALISLTTASLFLLIGAGCSPTVSPPTETEPAQQNAMADDTMEEKDDNTIMKDESDDTMMKDDTSADTTMMIKGSYEAYAPEKIALASADHDVVLFFHASWCPTCKSANDDITAHLTNIPDSLTLLKTDYDTETALKKTYGVTYQHTFVQVDAKGNMIKKWSGSPTLASIVGEVQ